MMLMYSSPATGFITTVYATEQEKGKYIATTWLFNATGSVMGACEPSPIF